ncbi:5-methylcytosine-specific restriction endonuclease McrA [Neobacillus niacini]|uniref:HNH endonuclease signature motif containing protein n=1 Tax=Neobacillus driksii TaxID=3035913 RepID=UPI00277FC13A|nr:HNH endonuclease [Neobacillus niacini]MDQ0976515.1 5-methylcytosine-specific restriction endonuclease McrA [Neobacillus niacini]
MPFMKLCSCGKRVPNTTICECKIEANRIRNREKNKRNAVETKFLKSAAWKKKRLKIIKRDGEVCQRCLIKWNIETTNPLEVHHIKPRSTHPELRLDDDNLITLCKSCNTQLGTKPLDFMPKPPRGCFF